MRIPHPKDWEIAMTKRIDAVEKVTGKAIYADDLKFDGMCYAVPLHSKYPSAEIEDIDISAALTSDGVVDIITANDIPGSPRVGGLIPDHYVIAKDRVRFMGEVVAVVAAESRSQAYSAADLIKVKYKPLDPVLDPRIADSKGTPKMHDFRKNNILSSFKVRRGNVERGYKNSADIVEEHFETSFIEHSYMEPESCVAIANPDGTVTVYGGMQHPFSTRRYVARALGFELARVQIIQTTLGGGFGGRDDTIAVICARAAILALRAKRPVKITYSREESIRESYKRHPFIMDYKAGISKDGKLQSMDVDILADAGPYCAVTPFVIWRPTVQCTGPYIVPNVRCDSKGVYTNNTPTGAMRGFGTPQQVFACESFIDICAEKVGMDPLEFRKRNFFRQNITTHTGQKLDNHEVSIREVTDKALAAIKWKTKFPKCSRGKPAKDGFLHGIGFACSYRGVSLGAEGNDFCSAITNIQPDGSILLEVGVSENGQGLKTAMASILAGELGIRIEKIRFIDTDTSSIPDGGPTVASRGTLVGGNAVIDSANKIKKMMTPVLKHLIGASKGGYIFAKGKIKNRESGKTISFDDAVAACHAKKMYLHSLGLFSGPKVSWDEDVGKGNAYFTYVYGCQACELTVDPSNGKVRVEKAVAAHEVGKAINPQMAAGQIFGGIMMGLGFALTESIVHKNGEIQNLNFNSYRIPRSIDAPEMTAILVENPDPAGPWGAKSLGEPTNELMGAAIANAIYYATGKRFTKTPITAQEILRAIGGKI